MIRVQVRPNETLEAALRRFKRQCNYAGIFRLAKKYSYHEKRSDRRRREERERIRNIQRAMRKSKQGPMRSMKRGKPKPRRNDESETTVDALGKTTPAATTAPVTPATTPVTTPAPAAPPAGAVTESQTVAVKGDGDSTTTSQA